MGAEYFAGWWPSLPNKWHGRGWNAAEPDWRPVYPDRVPLLGQYNDQATMDREIAAAAGHGLDFFAILWYFPRPGSSRQPQAKLLNRGLECFLASKNANRLAFLVEYCNARDFSAVDDSEWQQCVATWVAAMRHPSALRVDGRLVFKVHSASQFIESNNRDLGRCRQQLDYLRQAVRDAGLGEMLIGGGIMSRTQVTPGSAVAKLFDFTATYMSPTDLEPREAEYPFADLAAEARAARLAHAFDPIAWMPYVPAGWNPRPWTHAGADPHHRLFFTHPTRDQWRAELLSICGDFDKLPCLGLPTTAGPRQKAFTIYAWNEFGEGGFVAPTVGDGFMKLEVLEELFSGNPAKDETMPVAASAVAAPQPRALVIGGGGRMPNEVIAKFVELAGGNRARLVVVPTASETADQLSNDQIIAPWQSLGMADVAVLHTRSRETANDPRFVEPLRRATAVWFGGGDQSRISAAYLDTAVEHELYRLLARGGVVGGSSAGAAIQSRVMIAGGNPVPRLGTGFDLLPATVIDQHFVARQRKPRLMAALERHPRLVGLGIDERTAIVIQGRKLEVLGSGTVTVCRVAGSAGKAYEKVLKRGDTLNIDCLYGMAAGDSSTFYQQGTAP